MFKALEAAVKLRILVAWLAGSAPNWLYLVQICELDNHDSSDIHDHDVDRVKNTVHGGKFRFNIFRVGSHSGLVKHYN